MKPTVSICVPTYNGAEFLPECLDSILTQTYTDFELIIVDDKSADRTVEIARSYAAKDARITVIENSQNLGLVGNWNHCIELSQGEWVKFVFQDDKIEPSCLERMIAESTPDCDLVFCRRNFIFEANVSKEKREEYNRFVDSDMVLPNTTQISANEYCQAVLNEPWVNIVGEPTSSMVRKRAFDRFGLFNHNLIQICDLEFWDRVATNVGITFVRENLASFRVHSESATSKNHGTRTYRMELDFLILFHDFTFHPAYQNLRNFCRDKTKINLAELTIRETYYSWQKGKHIISSQSEECQEIEEVWNEVIQKYPRLTQVKTLNFYKQVQYEFRQKTIYLKIQMSARVNALKRRINFFASV